MQHIIAGNITTEEKNTNATKEDIVGSLVIKVAAVK